jgi:Zn finger protein HypA/HybF involved in hydrogenase expression
MIIKVEMYTVECDNCKETRGQHGDYSCWNDENYALEEAIDNEWTEREGNHYCPECHSWDDEDEIIINESRNRINGPTK